MATYAGKIMIVLRLPHGEDEESEGDAMAIAWVKIRVLAGQYLKEFALELGASATMVLLGWIFAYPWSTAPKYTPVILPDMLGSWNGHYFENSKIMREPINVTEQSGDSFKGGFLAPDPCDDAEPPRPYAFSATFVKPDVFYGSFRPLGNFTDYGVFLFFLDVGHQSATGWTVSYDFHARTLVPRGYVQSRPGMQCPAIPALEDVRAMRCIDVENDRR